MALAPLRPGDPSHLGSYELIRRLGAGGQGVVYLGRGRAGERVAIKVLHGDVDQSFLFRELSMARQVAPFCTAQILETGVSGDTPFVISEYIDGSSLLEVVKDDGPRAGGALQRLAIGTVTALAAIHQAGVVHRDFKPANVLLGPDGPRVIDFGIARGLNWTVTSGEEIRGTPAYMAPEQMSRQPAGTAADMFAWGATMMYAATGRSPFEAETLIAVMHRVLYSEPDVSELPRGLRELVRACLSKEPAARPTAQAVLIQLLGNTAAAPADAMRAGTVLSTGVGDVPTTVLQPGPPLPNPPAGPSSPVGPRQRARTWVAVAAGAVLLLAAGGAAAIAVALDSSPPVGRSPAAQSPVSAIPKAMNGTWSGTGHQPTFAKTPTFTIIMTLQGGGTTGSTLYPSVGCQGQLVFVPGSSGGVIRLNEHITRGLCTSSGQFTVHLSGKALSFTYQPDAPDGPASYGTLHR
jgi:eukaryotic-like serine/threonine-protein kinase